MKATAVIVPAPRTVALHDVVLAARADSHVTVAVGACGLCTWEQRVYRGTKPTYPFWGGHEVAGRVVDAPAGSGLAAGDVVALALMHRCGRCELCRGGLDNHCAYVNPYAEFASGPRGLSSAVVVPRYQVFRVSPEVTVQRASLCEPVACCLRSIDRARLAAGSRALVIGAGTMGLLHAVLLRRMAARVMVIDEAPAALDRATALGADRTASSTASDVDDAIAAWTAGRGVDAVFCTRGGGAGVKHAIANVRRGGTVVLFQSIRGDPGLRIDLNDLHYREVALVGTISQSLADFQRAAALLSDPSISFDALISARFGHHHAQEAFERALEPDSLRVLVEF